MTSPIIPTSAEHNYVVVTGIASPGRAQFTGVSTNYKWDVQPSYGMSGATQIFRGRDISKFTLTVTMWRLDHFAQWAVFAKLLEPPSPTKPLVVSMSHPVLAAAGISAVAVESVGQPERQPSGLWVATIKLMDYRPPVRALVKPRGAIPAVDKGKPITPKTAADLALEAATKDLAIAREAAR